MYPQICEDSNWKFLFIIRARCVQNCYRRFNMFGHAKTRTNSNCKVVFASSIPHNMHLAKHQYTRARSWQNSGACLRRSPRERRLCTHQRKIRHKGRRRPLWIRPSFVEAPRPLGWFSVRDTWPRGACDRIQRLRS